MFIETLTLDLKFAKTLKKMYFFFLNLDSKCVSLMSSLNIIATAQFKYFLHKEDILG